jgi:four helix bundle protein
MMERNRSYRELEVWKEAKKLVAEIYQITKTFPDEEKWCLTQQIRRAAISIPSNIAEGIGRNHAKDTIQFLYTSRGSLYELETQLFISFDLNYLNEGTLENVFISCNQVGKLLAGFINYYESKLVTKD